MRIANSRDRWCWALSRTFLHPYRLLAGRVPIRAAATKEQAMYFRTVRSVNSITGSVEIRPEVGGNAVRFQRDVIAWDRKIKPIIGQRLCYDVGQSVARQPGALNLQTI